MVHDRMPRLGPAVVTVVTALVLTGCANPLDKLVERGVEGVIEQVSGGEVQIGGITGSVDVPGDFPASVPLPGLAPDNALRVVIDGGPAWTLHYSADDAVYDDLRDRIVAAGFEEESSGDLADVMRLAQYSDGTHRIMLSLMGDDDEQILQLTAVELSG